MKHIAIFPARGGSKRLPDKNIRPFFGIPVILRSIEQARLSGLFDRIIVSTDCQKVARIVEPFAEVFQRATDDGSRGTQEVAAEVIAAQSHIGITYATVIYPVTPKLRAGHLVEAWSSLHKYGAKWVQGIRGGRDAGQFYMGYAYGFGVWPLTLDQIGYEVPGSVDVNTQSDWDLLESEWRIRGYK